MLWVLASLAICSTQVAITQQDEKGIEEKRYEEVEDYAQEKRELGAAISLGDMKNNDQIDIETNSQGNLIGCIVSIIASIIGNIGMNTQKQAHKDNMKRPIEKQVPYTYMPLWWCGMLGVVAGAVGDMVAVGMATQSLAVASGGATVLLCNCVVAKCWHKEPLSKRTLIGVLFIVAGAVIFAYNSPPARTYELAELAELASSPAFLVFIALQVIIVIICLGAIKTSDAHKALRGAYRPLVKKIDKKIDNRTKELVEQNEILEARIQLLESILSPQLKDYRQSRPSSASVDSQYSVDLNESTGDAATGAAAAPTRSLLEQGVAPLASLGESDMSLNGSTATTASGNTLYLPDGTAWTDAYAYAACSGMIGALSMLLSGCFMKVFLNLFNGVNEFDNLAPYIFVVAMVATVLQQTDLLNQALKYGEIMQIFPFFQAFWISFGIIGGCVFYKNVYNYWQWGLNIAAGLLMLIGCFLLTSYTKHVEKKKQLEKQRLREEQATLARRFRRISKSQNRKRSTAKANGEKAGVEMQAVSAQEQSASASVPESADTAGATDAAGAAGAGAGAGAGLRVVVDDAAGAPPTLTSASMHVNTHTAWTEKGRDAHRLEEQQGGVQQPDHQLEGQEHMFAEVDVDDYLGALSHAVQVKMRMQEQSPSPSQYQQSQQRFMTAAAGTAGMGAGANSNYNYLQENSAGRSVV